MSDELIPVTLWIAERGYRIKIKKGDEQAIRMAVKIADDRIAEMRNAYAGKDTQDFLAMCLLMYATDQVTEPNQLNPVQLSIINNMVEKIEKEIID